MIKKLRKRVIALTMIAVFIVLLLLMSIVNIVNYVSTNKSIDEILDLLEKNGGTFSVFGGPFDNKDDNPLEGQAGGQYDGQVSGQASGQVGGQAGGQADGQYDGQVGDQVSGQAGGQVSGQGGGGKHDGYGKFNADGNLKPGMRKETPFETRFFSVVLDESGQFVSSNTDRIAAISSEDAVALAKSIKEHKKSSFIKYADSIYKYRAVETADGNTQYIFVDVSRDMHSAESFLIISILVSLGGLIAIGALVIALSPAMIRPIAESYEKQKKFITNASHELKTPMAVIKSCNDVIVMEHGESKWSKAIGEQIDRLSDLTGQLVTLSRMDESLETIGGLEKENFDIAKLFVETLQPFSIIAQQKGLTFTGMIDGSVIIDSSKAAEENQLPTSDNVPSIPSMDYLGNQKTMGELFNILADNAIKYCLPNGEIKFSLSKQGKRIIVTEENPAEGLTSGNQSTLFERFYRGDESHSTGGSKPAGYGIGLSMAQAIVNAHGGTISAKCPDNSRIIFTVSL